ncbi:3862_t:CDS:2 [Acaulospora colombiana]|uniref:3862_t:CDS:1 n=1 Tax=Acaulospora colombiana TaxID=27376 RepID=A0ACA9PL39_9GLOM|nr:3862_t:CDS:2 [Acaulospora colombiana]
MLTMQRASWEQGVAAQALLEYEHYVARYPKQDLLPKLQVDPMVYLYGMAHEACLRASVDGRLATRVNSDDEGSDGGALDPACVGEAGIFVLEHILASSDSTAEPMRKAIDDMMNYLLVKAPRMEIREGDIPENLLPKDHDQGVLSHTKSHKNPQLWIDGVYMAPTFMVSYALSDLERFEGADSTQRTSWWQYLDSALDQVILYFHFLRLPSGLLGHIYDCNARAFSVDIRPGMNGSKAWGVGNGWALGSIVRILNALDRFFEQRCTQETTVRTAFLRWLEKVDTSKRLGSVAGLLTYTLPIILSYNDLTSTEGLFHNIIDDPSTFVETNLAQMISATIFRLLQLLKNGSLVKRYFSDLDDAWKEIMAAKAESLRNSAVAKVDKWGMVRGTCSSPRFDRPGTATEGQAWAILMEVGRAEFIMASS